MPSSCRVPRARAVSASTRFCTGRLSSANAGTDSWRYNRARPQPTACAHKRDDLHQPENRHVEVPKYKIPVQTRFLDWRFDGRPLAQGGFMSWFKTLTATSCVLFLMGCVGEPATSTPIGGTVGKGGAVGKGGTVALGGAVGRGGTVASGGTLASGGSVATGGTVDSGGTVASGGSQGSGGTTTASGGTGSGGTSGSGGVGGSGGASDPDASPSDASDANGDGREAGRAGGATSSGGRSGSGGTTSSGGTISTGGAPGTGGKAGTGGAPGTGGSTASGCVSNIKAGHHSAKSGQLCTACHKIGQYTGVQTGCAIP